MNWFFFIGKIEKIEDKGDHLLLIAKTKEGRLPVRYASKGALNIKENSRVVIIGKIKAGDPPALWAETVAVFPEKQPEEADELVSIPPELAEPIEEEPLAF